MQKELPINKSLFIKEFYLKKYFPLHITLIFIYSLIALFFFIPDCMVKEQKSINQSSGVFPQQKASVSIICSDFPFQNGKNSQGVVAEVEPTEDDIHHESLASNESYHPIIINDFFYTSYIKSRLLRLTSSMFSHTSIPYFVLYHSWKNFIV